MIRRRSTRLLITLGVVALLLVVGGISAASLLSGVVSAEHAQQRMADLPAAAGRSDLKAVGNPTAKLNYRVPADWEIADEEETLTTSTGVKLTHLADWGRYTCQGAEYGRAFTGSGVAPADRKPGRAASELAASVATDQYSDGHQTASVTVAKPEPVPGHGSGAAMVRAEATLNGAADGCAGSKGVVTVVALPTSAGNSVFVIGADLVPGTEQPVPLATDEQLRSVIGSVEVIR